MLHPSTTIRSLSADRYNGSSIGPGNDTGGLEKFPDHVDSFPDLVPEARDGPNKGLPPPRWTSRQSGHHPQKTIWDTFSRPPPPPRRARQKSLSDALRTIRTRNASISQNAQEIAEALRAPVDAKLIILCIIWYMSSVLTNTSSKSILNAFDMPATLTLVQFAFVSFFCLFFSSLASVFPNLRRSVPALKHHIRWPTVDILRTTFPLAVFQIGGHLFSSNATSKIPVSLVHTIKGLSPLFTVLAYRFIFDIKYPTTTYLSLVPLTLGVMLACSGNHQFGGQSLGVIYALSATLIFVTQNIYSKRLFNEAAQAAALGPSASSRKLDKLNLLCYSSGLAFLITLPIWFWTEGVMIIKDVLHDGAVDLSDKPNAFDHGRLTLEFIFNGTFHFGQNILAFILLSLVSPVTYSVASLLKRVFVVVVSIIWFRNATSILQAVGIALTFFGLYLYDRTNSNKADRKASRMTDGSSRPNLLPISVGNTTLRSQLTPVYDYSPANTPGFPPYVNINGSASEIGDKKLDPEDARQRDHLNGGWLPPGTKQEDTWKRGDL